MSLILIKVGVNQKVSRWDVKYWLDLRNATKLVAVKKAFLAARQIWHNTVPAKGHERYHVDLILNRGDYGLLPGQRSSDSQNQPYVDNLDELEHEVESTI